jgi:uncharacterized damage-inducible protein DinB
MTNDFLVKLFEHNNWANQKMIETCLALSDEQLDAEPHSATRGNIRDTLVHLVSAQYSYLRTLTLPVEERREPVAVPFAELQTSASESGKRLLALARGESQPLQSPLETRDRYHVEPWVLMVQIINHATEHREQINSMLTALGVHPLDLDGWSFGETMDALVPIKK